MVRQYELTSYQNCYDVLKDDLTKMAFQETLNYIEEVHKKINQNQAVERTYQIQIEEALKLDFLRGTQYNYEAYNIAYKAFQTFSDSINKKPPKRKKTPPHTFREEISERNLGILEKDYEQLKKEKSEAQFHIKLLLFAMVIQHSICYGATDKYFQLFLGGKVSKRDRGNIIKNYLKYKFLIKKRVKNKIVNKSDYTFLRNQIAHGNFILMDNEIIIYIEGNETDTMKYSYEDIYKIYNSVVVKYRFLKLPHVLAYYYKYVEKKRSLLNTSTPSGK